MKPLNLSASFFAIAGLLFSAASHAIVVTSNSDGTSLTNAIVGNGITVSNAAFTGATGAAGTFTDGKSAGIDFENGIILSNGSAQAVIGPNNDTGSSTENGFDGSDLLIPITGYRGIDASTLSFDFTSSGEDTSLNLIFGSEEYPNYVGEGFSDIFALFVDGVNVAHVPGTSSPMTVDDVYAANLFIDNYENKAFNTQMNGFTKSLQLNFGALGGGTHHVDFVIADRGDAVLDSWVFIETDSFASSPTDVPEPGSLLLAALGLLSLGFARRRQ